MLHDVRCTIAPRLGHEPFSRGLADREHKRCLVAENRCRHQVWAYRFEALFNGCSGLEARAGHSGCAEFFLRRSVIAGYRNGCCRSRFGDCLGINFCDK